MPSKQSIRKLDVVLTSSRESVNVEGGRRQDFLYEVFKSPRGPEYEVHCVKAKPRAANMVSTGAPPSGSEVD